MKKNYTVCHNYRNPWVYCGITFEWIGINRRFLYTNVSILWHVRRCQIDRQIFKMTSCTNRIKHCWTKINSTTATTTRRPASAVRTVRRHFQATGQLVSRTHAGDEAKCVQCRCFQCRSVTLRSDIRELSYPLPIYWYHSEGNWFRSNIAAESFMKWNFAVDFSSCIVETVQKTTNLGTLYPFWGT